MQSLGMFGGHANHRVVTELPIPGPRSERQLETKVPRLHIGMGALEYIRGQIDNLRRVGNLRRALFLAVTSFHCFLHYASPGFL